MSEFDTADALSKSAPKSLAAFMAAGDERARLWRTDELGAIFRHQLSAPILVDLGGFDPATAGRLKTLSNAQSLLLKSFLELFLHPVPPVELLTLTKEFAKTNMDHPDSILPKEVAAVLYYTSIAAGLVRLDQRISQLNDAELRRGFTWAKDQRWVDPPIQQLLAQGLQKLSPPGPASAATP
ncbi:MAG: hypothetical protein ABSH38_10180 [Verrucomicrobiota bacterium]|jgi:hypothetical protein